MKAGFALVFCATGALAQDEFVGPFPSWANVKSLGAVGDGKADDTAAIQRGLDAVGTAGKAAVLYFPAGTYRIASTLSVKYRQGLSLVGQDPASVTLRWDGPSDGTILQLNGIAYSKFSRLTFDGGGKAGVLVDQSFDGKGACCFDTGNEYSDDRFLGAPSGTGILGGNLGGGFAETTILRGRFLALRVGIAVKNFNAIDLWIWDSLFDRCETALSNDPGAGTWRVYNSVFRESRKADNLIGNTGGFTLAGNYTIGSQPFLAGGGTANPNPMLIQGNVVVNRGAAPIVNGSQGPILLVDNKIFAAPSKDPPVRFWQWTETDVFSIGNIFPADKTLHVDGRLATTDDKTGGTAVPPEPALPGVPPNYGRKIFEVAPGASAADIQALVNMAAKTGGKRAAVHFPAGKYEATLVVPAGDLQLIGDGHTASVIMGPIKLLGPASHVTLRDLSLQGRGMGDGVAVESADGPGGRVHLQGVVLRRSEVNMLYDRSLSGLQLDARDFDHTAAGRTGVVLEGKGTIDIFSAAGYGNPLSYRASAGKLLIRDAWYESDDAGYLQATGDASVTVASSHVFAPGTGTPTFDFRDFKGAAALLATIAWGETLSRGSGEGAVIGLGMIGDTRTYVKAPAAKLINSRTIAPPHPDSGSTPIPNQGVCDAACLRTAVKQLRESMPTPIRDLSLETTDIRLYRVAIYGFGVGLHVTRTTGPAARAGGKR